MLQVVSLSVCKEGASCLIAFYNLAHWMWHVARPSKAKKPRAACISSAGTCGRGSSHQFKEENGTRFRRRSRSASDLRVRAGGSAGNLGIESQLQRPAEYDSACKTSGEQLDCLSPPRLSHSSATGNPQDLGVSPLKSDFLPTELIQRSAMFNSAAE